MCVCVQAGTCHCGCVKFSRQLYGVDSCLLPWFFVFCFLFFFWVRVSNWAAYPSLACLITSQDSPVSALSHLTGGMPDYRYVCLHLVASRLCQWWFHMPNRYFAPLAFWQLQGDEGVSDTAAGLWSLLQGNKEPILLSISGRELMSPLETNCGLWIPP